MNGLEITDRQYLILAKATLLCRSRARQYYWTRRWAGRTGKAALMASAMYEQAKGVSPPPGAKQTPLNPHATNVLFML